MFKGDVDVFVLKLFTAVNFEVHSCRKKYVFNRNIVIYYVPIGRKFISEAPVARLSEHEHFLL